MLGVDRGIYIQRCASLARPDCAGSSLMSEDEHSGGESEVRSFAQFVHVLLPFFRSSCCHLPTAA